MNDLSVSMARAKQGSVTSGAGWGSFITPHLAYPCIKGHHQGNTLAERIIHGLITSKANTV